MTIKEPPKDASQIIEIFDCIRQLWNIYKDVTIRDLNQNDLQVVNNIITMKRLADQYQDIQAREYETYRMQKESEFKSSQYDSPA